MLQTTSTTAPPMEASTRTPTLMFMVRARSRQLSWPPDRTKLVLHFVTPQRVALPPWQIRVTFPLRFLVLCCLFAELLKPCAPRSLSEAVATFRRTKLLLSQRCEADDVLQRRARDSMRKLAGAGRSVRCRQATCDYTASGTYLVEVSTHCVQLLYREAITNLSSGSGVDPELSRGTANVPAACSGLLW